ncbi:MAG TPA: hypothetical protein V6D07_10735 [Trichocoleus sp.]
MPSQETTLELARQGNPDAIAALINSQLQPKGITAQVAFEEGCLQIRLASEKALNQETLVPYIQQGVVALGAESINRIKISSQQPEDINPSWAQEITLQEPVVPETGASANGFDVSETSDVSLDDLTAEAILREDVSASQTISSLDMLDFEMAEASDSDPLDLGFFPEEMGMSEETPLDTSEGALEENLDELAFADATQEMALEGLDPTLANTALDMDFDFAELSLNGESDPALSLEGFDQLEAVESELSDFDLFDLPVNEATDPRLALEDLTSGSALPGMAELDLNELALEGDLDQSLSLVDFEEPDVTAGFEDFELSDFSTSEPTGSGLSPEDLDEPTSTEVTGFDLADFSVDEPTEAEFSLEDLDEPVSAPSETSGFDLTDLSLEDELGQALSLGDLPESETEAGLEDFNWLEPTPESADPLSSLQGEEEPDLIAADISDLDLPDLTFANEFDQVLPLESLETPEVVSEPIDFDLSDFSLGESPDQSSVEGLAVPESDAPEMLDFDLADLSLGDDAETVSPEDLNIPESATAELTDIDLSDFSDFPLNESTDSELSLEGLDEPQSSASIPPDLDLGDLWLEPESDLALSLGEIESSDPTPTEEASVDFDLTDFPLDESGLSTDPNLSQALSLEGVDGLEGFDVPASTTPEMAEFDLEDLSLGDEIELNLSSEAFDTPTSEAVELTDVDLVDFSLDESVEPDLSLASLEASESTPTTSDPELGDLWLSEESDSALSFDEGDALDPVSTDAMLDFDLADLSESGFESPSEFTEEDALDLSAAPDLDLGELWLSEESEPALSLDEEVVASPASADAMLDFDLADLSESGFESPSEFTEEDALDLSSADAMLDFDLTDLSESGFESPPETVEEDATNLGSADAMLDFDLAVPVDSENLAESTDDLDLFQEDSAVEDFDAPEPTNSEMASFDLADLSFDDGLEDISLEGFDASSAAPANEFESDLTDFSLDDLNEFSAPDPSENISLGELDDLAAPTSPEMAEFDLANLSLTDEPEQDLELEDFNTSVLDPLEFIATPEAETFSDSTAGEFIDPFMGSSPFEEPEELTAEPEAFTPEADEMAGFDLADLSFDESTSPYGEQDDLPSDLADLSLTDESEQNLDLEDFNASEPDPLEFIATPEAETFSDSTAGEFIDPFMGSSPFEEPEELTAEPEAFTPEADEMAGFDLADLSFDESTSPYGEQDDLSSGLADLSLMDEAEQDLNLEDFNASDSDPLEFIATPELETPSDPIAGEFIDPFTASSPFKNPEELAADPEALTSDADEMAGFDLADLSFDESTGPEFASGPISSDPDFLLNDADLDSADSVLFEEPGAEESEEALAASGPVSFEVPEFSVADLSPENAFYETDPAENLEAADIPSFGAEPEAFSLDEGDEPLYPSSQDVVSEGFDADADFPIGFADDGVDELPADLLNWQDPLAAGNGAESDESLSGLDVESLGSNGAPVYNEPQEVESEDWALSESEPEQDIFVFDDDLPADASSNGQMTFDPDETASSSEEDAFVGVSAPSDGRGAGNKQGKKPLLPLLGGLGVLLVGLLAFGLYRARTPDEPVAQPQPAETTSPDPVASPQTQPSSQPQASADPFRDAVNLAGEASQLVQTAQTSEDWKQVADTWQRAIDLMQQVPQSSPNYAIAQQKAVEYLPNLQYAQQTYERLTASPAQ